METLNVVAEPLERSGQALVFCPHCFIECSVPAGESLAGLACVRCLQPLAPEPAPARQPALHAMAGWWDHAQAGGLGYATVVCARCEATCVVVVGAPVATVGCARCLRPLGPGPLLRHDLAGLRTRPWPHRLSPAA